MRRIIIDYKRLDHSLAALLIDLYPHGYGDDDIITLKKPNGEVVESVEIRTDDTVYLVKISKSLSNFISNFEERIEKELETTAKESVLENSTENDLEGEVDSDLDISGDVY
ncbi:hypothetical protein MTsPCn9_07410 [Croceitalea sp. MTPC9]|uniref:hypothetical protein n=1 Tax=unclassified Croceitalea TaxID=2632280 RepID=UPI002B3C4BED|nr:hypothetical protein MTsPCn6_01300 [Croceitalea sp. MTPC6]GMN15805.1 hypothetical protein MTsPCn9_07410 [Croceitalea sp. MTPC9]